MDTLEVASSPDWAHLLATQMAALEQQKQEMGEIHSVVQSLGQRVNRLAVGCVITTPEAYGGDPKGCEGFIIQSELFFIYQPCMPDHAKVAFKISRLIGKVRVWGTALVVNSSPLMNNYSGFVQELRSVFHHLHQGRLYGQALQRLRQGLKPATEYTMAFRTLAAGT
uniref:DUF4939 domain-containing protein n=1 Tax=Electrophorus electricus TaxID=8005 RepID=A0AAY5F3D9_ELEEL